MAGGEKWMEYGQKDTEILRDTEEESGRAEGWRGGKQGC